jgi:hypothetical protein
MKRFLILEKRGNAIKAGSQNCFLLPWDTRIKSGHGAEARILLRLERLWKECRESWVTDMDLRPKQILTDYYTRHREPFRGIYMFVEHRGRDGFPDWSPWCFAPLSAAYAAVSGGGENRLGPDQGALVGIIGALAAWRVSQGIYRFDRDVFSALWETPIDEYINEEILFRLPEYCLYIETPGKTALGGNLHGFGAHLEEDSNSKEAELRLLLDMESGPWPFPIHLGHGGLVEGIKQTIAVTLMHYPHQTQMPSATAGDLFRELSPLISLVLYLCSENAEMASPRGSAPALYRLQKVKGGLRASRPTVTPIGTWPGGSERPSETPGQPMTARNTPERAREPQNAPIFAGHTGIPTGQAPEMAKKRP